MAKRTGFIMVGGDLLYAKGGRKVTKEYTTKLNQAGNVMVYNEKGRLVGYVRNPKNKAEMRNLIRAEERVTRMPFYKEGRKEQIRRDEGLLPNTALSKNDYEIASYQKALKGMFDAGLITSAEQEQMFQLFKEGSKYTRYGLWEDLKMKDSNKGHAYFS